MKIYFIYFVTLLFGKEEKKRRYLEKHRVNNTKVNTNFQVKCLFFMFNQ